MPRRGDTFQSANYVPEFGDIVHVDWSPAVGHEMIDPHYGLVVSATLFNTATGMVVAVPITSKAGKVSSFELPVSAGRVNGVAVLSGVRALNCTTRAVAFEHASQRQTAIDANKRIALFLPTV
jgi:mRNA-degrading endonuclease toxin of MazEF toxin-antitoxin module